MRQILMTVMLVIVVVSLYAGTVGGSGGMQQNVKTTGGRLNGTIGSINP
ncbi:hypothetical protein [Paenibacillus flagellatus]|nr:hypothetical protein [Paenibacillus flagellatus]